MCKMIRTVYDRHSQKCSYARGFVVEAVGSGVDGFGALVTVAVTIVLGDEIVVHSMTT